MNVLWETPFDVGSVARQHNKAKSGKKLQSFYLQPGDAIVFSDRQFHWTGHPSTFPSPDNMQIHFLCANNADDTSGRYMLVFPTPYWNNMNNKLEQFRVKLQNTEFILPVLFIMLWSYYNFEVTSPSGSFFGDSICLMLLYVIQAL
jgi:hypothetical protein